MKKRKISQILTDSSRETKDIKSCSNFPNTLKPLDEYNKFMFNQFDEKGIYQVSDWLAKNLHLEIDIKTGSLDEKRRRILEARPKGCQKVWKFGPLVGIGASGSVLVACRKKTNSCCFVAKFVALDTRSAKKHFQHEIQMQTLAYTKTQPQPVTTKIYDIFYCDAPFYYSSTSFENLPYGVIVSKRMQGTIASLLEKLSSQEDKGKFLILFNQILLVVARLNYVANIFHEDLHLDNILYSCKDESKYDLRIIDLEDSSIRSSTDQDNVESIAILMKAYFFIIPHFQEQIQTARKLAIQESSKKH